LTWKRSGVRVPYRPLKPLDVGAFSFSQQLNAFAAELNKPGNHFTFDDLECDSLYLR
jgi:hypothetical protein